MMVLLSGGAGAVRRQAANGRLLESSLETDELKDKRNGTGV
jgi:hypothetical protein